MSITSAIQNAQIKVAAIYTAISDKGGTLPITQDLSNMSTAITSIPSDGIYIPREVKNGVYQMPTESFVFTLPSDVTNISERGLYYAFIGCTALTSVDLPSLTTISGQNSLFFAFYNCTGLTSVDLSSLTTVSGSQSLSYAFQNCTGLTSVDLSSLATVSGNQSFCGAFYGCSSLTSVDLSSLATVSGDQSFLHAFSDCTGLTSVDLSSLTTVSGSSSLSEIFSGCTSLTGVDLSSLTTVGNYGLTCIFKNCSALTSVDLSSLTTVSGSSGLQYAFYGCTGLTTVDLSALTTVSGDYGLQYAFNGCTGLTNIYFRLLSVSSFGSYTNQFNNMMSETGTTTTHTIHFPANMESIISDLDGYPLFGGESNYVVLAYDLPATSGSIIFDNKTTETLYINGSMHNSNSYYHNGEETSYIVVNANNVIYSNTITPSTVMSNYTIDVSSLFTNPNTITLATSVSGLTVTFDVNGAKIPAITDGNGNYSIGFVESGISLSYVIKGEGYATVRGTTTTTGLDITIPITMEPATEEPWTRPNLTSNGQIGGDSFAVTCTPPYFEEQAWMAVDDVTQDGYHTEWYAQMEEHPEYIFYNPNPIKVSELKFVFSYRMAEEIEVYASEDGTTWESLDINYNPEPEYDETTDLRYTTCTLTNDDFYSYYKIVFIGYDVVTITDLEITATQSV